MYKIFKKYKLATSFFLATTVLSVLFFKELKHELSKGDSLPLEKVLADVPPPYTGDGDDDDDGN